MDTDAKSFEWSIERDQPAYVLHGWYSLEDGRIAEHVGGGSTSTDEVLNLKLTVSKGDDKIVLTRFPGSRTRTSWPAGAGLQQQFLQQEEKLSSDRYTVLWRGDFEQSGGKIVKTIIYAARLASSDEMEKGFLGQHDPVPQPVLPSAATAPASGPAEEAETIESGTILRISIVGLFDGSNEVLLERQVDKNGTIDLPLLANRLKVAGLSRGQAQEAVADAYIAAKKIANKGAVLLIIRSEPVSAPAATRPADVSMLIPSSGLAPTIQDLNYALGEKPEGKISVIGGVAQPGRYDLGPNGLRVTDALALAKGVKVVDVDRIYVTSGRYPGGVSTQASAPSPARTISIDYRTILAGDPRQNIVLRDGDTLIVPPMVQGEFYVMGQVQRPGVYSLTDRKITVKMALAAAENPEGKQFPDKGVLVRRSGESREEYVPLNIKDILPGKESDIFLQPNDVIAVGMDIDSARKQMPIRSTAHGTQPASQPTTRPVASPTARPAAPANYSASQPATSTASREQAQQLLKCLNDALQRDLGDFMAVAVTADIEGDTESAKTGRIDLAARRGQTWLTHRYCVMPAELADKLPPSPNPASVPPPDEWPKPDVRKFLAQAQDAKPCESLIVSGQDAQQLLQDGKQTQWNRFKAAGLYAGLEKPGNIPLKLLLSKVIYAPERGPNLAAPLRLRDPAGGQSTTTLKCEMADASPPSGRKLGKALHIETLYEWPSHNDPPVRQEDLIWFDSQSDLPSEIVVRWIDEDGSIRFETRTDQIEYVRAGGQWQVQSWRSSTTYPGRGEAGPSFRTTVHLLSQLDAPPWLFAQAAASTQPAGASWGPAVERVINSFDSNTTDSFVDMDSGRLLTPPREALFFTNLGQLSRAWEPALAKWIAEGPADVGVMVGKRRDGTVEGTLVGIHLQAVAVPRGRWDSISPQDVLSFLEKAPERMPTTRESPTSDRVFLKVLPGDLIAFRTAQGGAGILQVVAFTDGASGMKIGYRIASVSPGASQPAASATSEPATQPAALLSVEYNAWLKAITLRDGTLTYTWATLKPGRVAAKNADAYDWHEFTKPLSPSELALFAEWAQTHNVFALPDKLERLLPPPQAQLSQLVVVLGDKRYAVRLEERIIPDKLANAIAALDALCQEIRQQPQASTATAPSTTSGPSTQPAGKVTIEGAYVLDKPLEIKAELLHPPVPPQKDAFKVMSAQKLIITRKGEQVQATLSVSYSSWPKATYVTMLEVLDSAGKVLASDKAFVEGSGIIAGVAIWKQEELVLPLGQYKDLSSAAKWRLALEIAAPAELPSPATPTIQPATQQAGEIAWRDKDSNQYVGMSGAELAKRLGTASTHANAEPVEKFSDKDELLRGAPLGPVGVVGHFYDKLRPDATLVIRMRLNETVVYDAYWCQPGKHMDAFYSPPAHSTTQPAGGPNAESSKATSTRVYDVRDLVLPIENYELPPVWAPAQKAPKDEAAESAQADATKAKLVLELIKLIQEQVDPESWQGPGAVGSIREMQGMLVIAQTAKNQESIVTLLQQLRVGRSLQVHVKSQFIVMSAKRDQAMQLWLAKNVKGGSLDEKTGSMYLNADQAAALVKGIQGSPDAKMLATPRLTVFNGQRASVTVATEQALEVSLLDKQGKADVKFLEGAVLDVQPTVLADKKHVNVTLRPRFTKLLSEDALPRFSQATKDLTVSIPDKMTLLLRVPLAERKVRGAVEQVSEKGDKTIEVVSAPADAAATPQDYLYFLVEPTIIELREVEANNPASQPATAPSSVAATQPAGSTSQPANNVLLRLVDKDGKPVAGVAVEVTYPDEQTRLQRACKVVTGEDGRVACRVPGSVADLAAVKEGFRQIGSRQLQSGDQEQIIRLKRSLTVKGRVTDADTGKVIDQFRLTSGSSWDATRPDAQSWDPKVQICTGGEFTWSPKWDYPLAVLKVEADNHYDLISRPLIDDEGEITLDLAMQPAKDIVGQVIDESGKPVAQADVYVATSSHRANMYNGLNADMKSVSDGRFWVRPQREVFAVLVAAPAGFGLAGKAALEKDGTVRLQPWAQVSGQVVIDGKPQAGATVKLWADRQVLNASYDLETTTDAQGNFAFPRVPPGACLVGRQVKVEKGYTGMWEGGDHGQVLSLEPAQNATVNIGGTGVAVSGRLLMPDGSHFSPAPYFVNARLTPLVPEEQEQPKLPANWKAMTNDQRQAWAIQWQSSKEGIQFEARRMSRFVRHVMAVAPDGSFQVSDIPPGADTATVDVLELLRAPPWGMGQRLMSGGQEFRVGDKPVDLGDLGLLALVNPPAANPVAQPASQPAKE